jgi:hypothetical protein
MSTKQRITSVFVDREGIVSVRPTDDQTRILVTGLAPGRVLITLTGADGRKETHRMGR